ncbi:MAG TPA: carboxymuconolactone decarboxylase family protein [Rhizomicrobium sp.]|jgi:alkylhydroperoxidase family enzyme|nr:carboxymuconolactone decarboxylase family protein [Rhizomicrobium sp.]
MPLISYADMAHAPQDVREAFARMPRKLNVMKMLANAAAEFVPCMRLGGAILGRQKLMPQMRELVILAVSHLEGGIYEWVQHVPIAEASGCSRAKIDAIEQGAFEAPCFDDREQTLLRFARQVIENVRADEEAVRAANRHFSPQEVVEIIVTCGFYMMLARLTETTRTDIDPPAGTAVVEELARLR